MPARPSASRNLASPARLNITKIVNSSATSVIGAMREARSARGTKPRRQSAASPRASAARRCTGCRGRRTRSARSARARCRLPRRTGRTAAAGPDEQPRVDAEEGTWKIALKATSPAAYSVDPPAKPRSTRSPSRCSARGRSGSANHVLRQVGQEGDGEREHQHRADDPVLHQRQRQHPAVAEHVGQVLEAHLGERRTSSGSARRRLPGSSSRPGSGRRTRRPPGRERPTRTPAAIAEKIQNVR